MKSTVVQFTCDRCERVVDEVVSVKFWIGFYADEVSQEDDVRVKDFCHSCVQVAFQRVLNRIAYFDEQKKAMETAMNPLPLARMEIQVTP
mgnify:CR=1 FL=1